MNDSTISCPAVGETSVLSYGYGDPTVRNIACYAHYQTGEAGANISLALSACCNSTPVVVNDSMFRRGAGDPGCVFYANVTRNDGSYGREGYDNTGTVSGSSTNACR